MQDRVPTYPGRVTLTPVSGQADTFDMARADEPTQEGTPLNKATLLTDETAAAIGLTSEEPTVNEALRFLSDDSSKVGDLKASTRDLETETEGRYVACDGRTLESQEYEDLYNILGLLPGASTPSYSGSQEFTVSSSSNYCTSTFSKSANGGVFGVIKTSSTAYVMHFPEGGTPTYKKISLSGTGYSPFAVSLWGTDYVFLSSESGYITVYTFDGTTLTQVDNWSGDYRYYSYYRGSYIGDDWAAVCFDTRAANQSGVYYTIVFKIYSDGTVTHQDPANVHKDSYTPFTVGQYLYFVNSSLEVQKLNLETETASAVTATDLVDWFTSEDQYLAGLTYYILPDGTTVATQKSKTSSEGVPKITIFKPLGDGEVSLETFPLSTSDGSVVSTCYVCGENSGNFFLVEHTITNNTSNANNTTRTIRLRLAELKNGGFLFGDYIPTVGIYNYYTIAALISPVRGSDVFVVQCNYFNNSDSPTSGFYPRYLDRSKVVVPTVSALTPGAEWYIKAK